ncbi:MAG TPA: DUF2786 domain-containing protein [Polyangiaceae bacterium]|nr:DUF2786 domain-containing protein [Polyangiaceae bacterium]
MTALGAALSAALLRELVEHHRLLNASLFRGALTTPRVELVPVESRLGRWVPSSRTIEISSSLVVREPWGTVVEVLKHEMAHQYMSERHGDLDETAHGPVFRELCARLAIDGRATGLPDATDPASDRIASRVARLLALAESPNVHEAEAAMLAAQRLLLKHNLDLSAARAARGHSFRHLGRPTGRVTEAERALSLILAHHFFVECIWIPVYRPLEGKRGSVLEVCGTPENLEIAEYVHGYLLRTAERLWAEHKRARGLPGDADRRRFLAGVMHGMLEKLGRDAMAQQEDGLVWVRDADLHGYYRRRHPHVRHVRSAGERRTAAYAEGREAGRGIEIHKGIKGQAASPRLLNAKP